MKNGITTIVSLLTFLFFFSTPISADDNFHITSLTTYVVSESGETAVTQDISITNNKEFIHAPTYTFTLNVEGIEEMQVVTGTGTSIPFTVNDTENDGKKIEVVFPDRIVGKGKSQKFSLKYKTTMLVHKLGNTLEVNIPGVKSKEFTSSKVTVIVPQSLGEATLVKPGDVTRSGTKYTFPPNSLSKSGALLIFGAQEYYRLQLSYNLENANFFPLRTEIALPPTTAYQEIILEKINPKPQRVYTDSDGNYLAEFTLKPQEKRVVHADVLVKVFTSPKRDTSLTESEKNEYTSSQKYWEQGTDMKKVARELKTPENIYNFLVNEFKYNHTRTADLTTRLGAPHALHHRDNLVCLEFTDLFVALARAAGIQARSVEGYAYTQNPQIRPRALVQDVLHAWPEYYDGDRQQWIMIDPTWGNTTVGIDYFHTMDTAHIAFVRKGMDSQYPVPVGGYKAEATDKQVKVSFIAPDEFEKREEVSLAASIEKGISPFSSAKAAIEVRNTGNTPVLAKTLTVTDQKGNSEKFTLSNIPPFGTQKVLFSLTTRALTKADHQLTMQLGDEIVTAHLSSGLEEESLLILTGGGLFGALILGLSVKGGSLYFQRRRK